MRQRKKRWVSILTALCLALALLPGTALAAENIVNSAAPGAPVPSIPMSGDVWDGSTECPTTLVQRDGIGYYEISKCSQLAYLAQAEGEWLTYNYILTNNLILNDTVLTWDEKGNCINAGTLLEWKPIDRFHGIFNGNGFTISGVYINQKNQDNIGLFGIIKESDILNLSVVNSFILGNENVGGIIGTFDIAWNDDSVFQNCAFSGYVRACTSNAGGLVGFSRGGYGFSYLSNYGTVQADTNAGGITSSANRLDHCYNFGDVSYLESASRIGNNFGGISAGKGDFSYCINFGTVYGLDNVGGIYGIGDSGTYTISCCENKGIVNGENCVGGIAGKTKSEGINACKNSGLVTGKEDIGGIVGHQGIGWYPKTYTVNNS